MTREELLKQEPTIQICMHILLSGLGFAAMAKEVLQEKEEERLNKYAAIIRKQSSRLGFDHGRNASKMLRRFGY